MTSTRLAACQNIFITDGGGWSEGNEVGAQQEAQGTGNTQITIGCVPLKQNMNKDPVGLQQGLVQIYASAQGFECHATIVLEVSCDSPELPIYFEPDGPLSPGIKGHSDAVFNPDQRELVLDTTNSSSYEFVLTVTADGHLHDNSYNVRVINGSNNKKIEEVELIKASELSTNP